MQTSVLILCKQKPERKQQQQKQPINPNATYLPIMNRLVMKSDQQGFGCNDWQETFSHGVM